MAHTLHRTWPPQRHVQHPDSRAARTARGPHTGDPSSLHPLTPAAHTQIKQGGNERFYAATRPPGGLCDLGLPPQAVWVGEDRAYLPCPRVGSAVWRAERRGVHTTMTRVSPQSLSTRPTCAPRGCGVITRPLPSHPRTRGVHAERLCPRASDPCIPARPLTVGSAPAPDTPLTPGTTTHARCTPDGPGVAARSVTTAHGPGDTA